MDNSTSASNPGKLKVNVFCWLIHKPLWPAIWAGTLVVAGVLAILMHWAWWAAAGLLLLANLFYWVRIKEQFRSGCVNPAVVVAVEPALIAVSTDLAKGIGNYPAIKIRKVPLRTIDGRPVSVGMRLATVAGYVSSADPQQPHWDDFDPHPVQLATFDQADIDSVTSCISREDWLDLDDGLKQVPQPFRPGLYMVRQRGTSFPPTKAVPVEHITAGCLATSTVKTNAAAPERASAEDMERIPHHTGGPLPADADLFVDPPAEIGLVTSAATTLRRGREPWSPASRAGFMVVLALVGLLLGGIIVKVCDIRDDFWWWPCMGGGFGLGAFLGWFASNFSHTCTYVGQEGVAHYECSGRRSRLTSSDVFLFRDATELRTEQTRNYTNGIYQNTTYTFTWTDVGGRERYVISGSHESKEGAPPPDDLFHYARTAETAWTMDLFKQAQRQIELAGFVRFNLKGNRWIRLAPERLAFRLHEKPEEFAAGELARVYVENGTVTFLRKDGCKGLLPSNGVYRFAFANLANAKLFLLLLDSLLGFQLEYWE